MFQYFFVLSLLFVLHSYLFYPLLLFALSLLVKKEATHLNLYHCDKKIAILMAVHNEESVIVRKIESILANCASYSNFEVLIGSDCSEDKTNALIQLYTERFKFIKFTIFNERRGKAKIINDLVSSTNADIIIITDANVLFSDNLLKNISQPFDDENVGLVESNVFSTGMSTSGISYQESAYIRIEKQIKRIEGDLFGRLMGPFGGCYAIRRQLYVNIPDQFVVDDFFVCMNVLLSGKYAIGCRSAVVYEDVSNNITDEFNRKVRISMGNFQNLVYFLPKIIKKDIVTFIIFLSHKILRWFTPFFMLIAFISCLFLVDELFYRVALFLSTTAMLFSLFDFVLRRANINIVLFRFATHFLSMNLALLIGYLNYLKGVKTNVWQPTKRNQSAKIDAQHD